MTQWSLLALLAAWFVLVITNVVLAVRLRDFRTDLSRGESFTAGRSRVWQWNLLRRANYSTDGRKRLVWLYAGLALHVGVTVAFLALFLERT